MTLFMTGALALGTITYALKRVSLAQSVCVQAMTRLQAAMGPRLLELQELNHPAQILRLEKLEADEELLAAVLAENPIAIALAEAHQISVHVRQTALRTRQLGLLAEAEVQRRRLEHEVDASLRGLRASRITSKRGYMQALAVEPIPADSLSPDYVTVNAFRLRQQHTLAFDVGLAMAGIPWPEMVAGHSARTMCAVSLRREGVRWRPDILAASAPLN